MSDFNESVLKGGGGSKFIDSTDSEVIIKDNDENSQVVVDLATGDMKINGQIIENGIL